MVQIALPVLHQQDGGHAGQLQGGVVAGGLRVPRQLRILLLEQVADPVGLPVHGAHQGAAGAQAPQHVKLDGPDHPPLLLLRQGGGIGPGAVLAVLLVGEADEAQLRVGVRVLQRLRRVEQGGRAGGVVVGAVGGGHAVVVGGENQNIGVRSGRLFHSDDIVPGAALAVGVGLEGDGVAHGLKPPLQVLDGVRLPLGADGPVGGGEGLQIRPEPGHIGQGVGPLQHHQGLRRRNRAGGGQPAAALPGHHAGLEGPEHRRPGPLSHGSGVPELIQPLNCRAGGAGPPPEDGGELLPGDGAAGLVFSVPHAGEIALLRRPGHRVGVVTGHVGEGALP